MNQCERCGHQADRIGPDGYCNACADKLRRSEEWDEDDERDQEGGKVPPPSSR